MKNLSTYFVLCSITVGLASGCDRLASRSENASDSGDSAANLTSSELYTNAGSLLDAASESESFADLREKEELEKRIAAALAAASDSEDAPEAEANVEAAPEAEANVEAAPEAETNVEAAPEAEANVDPASVSESADEIEFDSDEIESFDETELDSDDFGSSDEIEFDSDDFGNSDEIEFDEESSRPSRLVAWRLKALGVATQNYHDDHNAMPAPFSVDADGKPLHSWRVHLLPFLEHQALYAEIRLDEPWDSEWNSQFHSTTPQFFASPDEPELAEKGLTRFGVVVDTKTVWNNDERNNFAFITDGTSNTIAFVERKEPVCWMAPDQELTFEETQREGLNVLHERDDCCVVASADGSLESRGGCLVAFVDGAVRVLETTTAPEIFEALLTRDGGEFVNGSRVTRDFNDDVNP